MRTSNIKFSNLRAEMARKEITIKAIAEEVKVTRDTMGSKLAGKRPLYLNEAFVIKRKFFPDKTLSYLFAELLNENVKAS